MKKIVLPMALCLPLLAVADSAKALLPVFSTQKLGVGR